MKKITVSLFLTLSFLVFMACTPSGEIKEEGVKCDIQALVSPGRWHQSWVADDMIAVFDGVNQSPAVFKNISGSGSKATFSGEISSKAKSLVAVYPYSPDWKLDGEICALEAPTLQFVSSGQPFLDSLYTSAVAPIGGAFTFSPEYSLLSFELDITVPVREMTVSAIGEEKVGRENNIKLVPESGEVFDNGVYYAIVTPQLIQSGIVLRLKSSAGKEADVKLMGPLNFTKGGEISIPKESFDDLIWGDGSIVLNGTPIDITNSVYGLVKNSATGEGIPGVQISDGYQIVLTDENGVYQMRADGRVRRIFYSLPSGFEVSLDPENHRPMFYSSGVIDPHKFQRCDFSLSPADWDQENFTVMAIGDPQCATLSDIDRYKKETITDIVNTLDAENAEGRYLHPYAIALGDIGYDNDEYWPNLKQAASNISTEAGFLPLFHCMGNHDHDSLTETDYDSCTLFVDTFGPENYSFNIGKVHFIVMDNIRVKEGEKKSSNHTNKYSWSYSTGITDSQLAWLEKDIELVGNKSDILLIFCCHIPFYGNSSFASAILPLFKPFHEAHILSGHTHYPLNEIHSSYRCAGGLPVYEHVHGAACGAFWSSRLNGDGQPNGYSFYQVEGNSIVNWVAKGTQEPFSLQMRVYDGNQMFTGKKGYEYYWYYVNNPVNSQSILASKGCSRLKGCFVVSLWNDDLENWNVELWQRGEKVGDFHRVARNECCEIPVASFNFNNLGKSTSYYNVATPGHIWYFMPQSQNPSSETDWKVVAKQKIPGSMTVNTYEADVFQTDYTGFAK